MRSLTFALVASLAVAVPVALAASKNGVRALAPKPGASVPVGQAATFKGKVVGEGSVFVFVSKSKKIDKDGLIGSDAHIQKAKRKANGTFSMKARYFSALPEQWLNNPGAYYWQAHRIDCEVDGGDCYKEGPVVKFKVK